MCGAEPDGPHGGEPLDTVGPSLLGYLARRVAATVVLLATVVVVVFLLISLAPGDTALTLAGSAGGDPEYLARLRERLGLDQPSRTRRGRTSSGSCGATWDSRPSRADRCWR
ncbi:MAG: hypothetical protein ACRDZ9_06860 [Acidimicrobiales bacterium]